MYCPARPRRPYSSGGVPPMPEVKSATVIVVHAVDARLPLPAVLAMSGSIEAVPEATRRRWQLRERSR